MRTILLVDDSRVVREVMKVYLITSDHVVLEASNGLEALTLARQRRPDVVVADLRMPKLDGLALCGALCEPPAIPVIILTSNDSAEAAEQCLRAGARAVLTKPVEPKRLLEAVRRCLTSSPSPAVYQP